MKLDSMPLAGAAMLIAGSTVAAATIVVVDGADRAGRTVAGGK